MKTLFCALTLVALATTGCGVKGEPLPPLAVTAAEADRRDFPLPQSSPTPRTSQAN